MKVKTMNMKNMIMKTMPIKTMKLKIMKMTTMSKKTMKMLFYPWRTHAPRDHPLSTHFVRHPTCYEMELYMAW